MTKLVTHTQSQCWVSGKWGRFFPTPSFLDLTLTRGYTYLIIQECCSHRSCQKCFKPVVSRLLEHISTRLYMPQFGLQKQPPACASGLSSQMELLETNQPAKLACHRSHCQGQAGLSTPSLLAFKSPMWLIYIQTRNVITTGLAWVK